MTQINHPSEITQTTIEAVAGAMVPIVGDAALIVADARLTCPTLPADPPAEVMMDFVGRVLEHCVARLDGSSLQPSRTPAADAALAAATLRSIAGWPGEHSPQAAAWQTAVDLFLRVAPAPDRPRA